ncbi:OsmC family protein [[Eubacterium] cellulosolvens]
MSIKPQGNFQFKVRTRHHELICDRPDHKDQGMIPSKLLITSLGSCIGFYVESYCKQAQIPIDNMTVTIRWEKASNPARIGSIKIDVALPEERAKERKMAIWRAAENCLIHNTLRHHPNISLEISVE